MGGDLRGAGRLAVEAVAGLAGLVETVHANAARLPGTRPPSSGRTSGVTALAYAAARGVTRVVGNTVDTALALLEPLLAERSTRPGYEALLAALNGVLGDWLEARSNPLAIRMRLRSNGVALTLEPPALAAALPNASGRVVVLVHGLCMDDLQWARHGADFGAALARDLGVTPIHLHYNRGRHISTNGRDFAALMDALVRAWPVPLESVDLVTHSMGGLVARSALHQAEQNAQALAPSGGQARVPGHAATWRTAGAQRPAAQYPSLAESVHRTVHAPGRGTQRRHHRPALRQPARQ
jgi:pimeloyl-ACP methyl ester carboxylesterase